MGKCQEGEPSANYSVKNKKLENKIVRIKITCLDKNIKNIEESWKNKEVSFLIKLQ